MLQWNKRSFFYNAGVMTLSGLCLQGIGFVYRIYLSRAAGAEGLGLYRLILPIHSLSIAICIAGVRMAATSLSAELRAIADRPAVRVLTRLCLTIYLAVFLLAAAVVIGFRDPIAVSMLGDIRTSPALPVMMLCIFLTGFELILESIFLGIGETRYTAVSNLLEQLTQMAAVICLLTRLHPTDSGETALWIVTGMVIAEIPVVIWLLISYRRVICKDCRVPNPVPRGMLRRIGKIALPVTIGGAVTTLLTSAGTVLLPRRLVAAGLSEARALEELGIISGMAQPLMSFPMLFISAMATVLLPTLSASMTGGSPANTRRKIRKAFQAVSLIALPATAILLPLAPELSELLYGQVLSTRYLALLAVSVILVDYQLISLAVLNGLGQQSRAFLHVIVGEALDLLLIYLLAGQPQLQIYGYLLANIASAGTITALNLWWIRKKTGTRLSLFRGFALPALSALAAGLLTRAAYCSFCRNFGAAWALLPAFLLGCAACVLLYLLIGIRPLRYFRSVCLPKNETKG